MYAPNFKNTKWKIKCCWSTLNPIQPGSTRFNPIQPDSTQFNPIQPDSTPFNLIQPDSNRFNSIQPDSTNYSRFESIRVDSSWSKSILVDSSRLSDMFSMLSSQLSSCLNLAKRFARSKNCQKIAIISMLNLCLKCAGFYDMGINKVLILWDYEILTLNFYQNGGGSRGLRGGLPKRPQLATKGGGGQNSRKIGYVVSIWMVPYV